MGKVLLFLAPFFFSLLLLLCSRGFPRGGGGWGKGGRFLKLARVGEFWWPKKWLVSWLVRRGKKGLPLPDCWEHILMSANLSFSEEGKVTDSEIMISRKRFLNQKYYLAI